MSGITEETLRQLTGARPAYKWRVQEARESGANCVAYIDARQVMVILDEVVGAANWQDHYREVAGNVYCDLSIRIDGEWVTKSDCGSESNIEAEKGQASDAFKRAAVKWGIGRFLYELPIVRIKETIKGQNGKYAPAHNGKRIWDVSEHIRKTGLDRSGQSQKSQAHLKGMATKEQKESVLAAAQNAGWNSEQLGIHIQEKGWAWKQLTHDQAVKLLGELEQLAKQGA